VKILIQNVSCQPNEVNNIFGKKNLNKCQRYVRSIQRKLDKAVADNDSAKIRWYVHLLSKRSSAAKILAVWRITKKNDGKYTAGVDGIKIPRYDTDKQNEMRLQILSNINIEGKPDPIRRVHIPKPNGKLRPLGIPTLANRVNQEIVRQAIEPITEYHFLPCSYGFRPKRSCHDAIKDIHTKMSQASAKRWVVEGDIKGCFDNINHSHIITTLRHWKVPKWTLKVINRMLESKIFHNGEICESITGTPQGGVISPMLANVALTILDEEMQRKFGWKSSINGKRQTVNPIIRYADDFIIICDSPEKAKQIKEWLNAFLFGRIGLELSDEKTHITHISKGFDFLGVNFKKYKTTTRRSGEILLPKPSKEKIKDHLYQIKQTIKSLRTAPQLAVIQKLNPIIRGWGNYYRHVVSKEIFCSIDYQIWWKLYRWAKRRHPNKTDRWALRRYFSTRGNWKTVFTERKTQNTLARMATIPIKRYTKVKGEMRVYDKNAIKYWQEREQKNAKLAIFKIESTTGKLMRQQKGNCAFCKTRITFHDIRTSDVHQHHMKPRQHGGNNKLSNLRLLHNECHSEIHRMFTLEEMNKYSEQNFDYLKYFILSLS
jgi:RNA-directed DNA polymerase